MKHVLILSIAAVLFLFGFVMGRLSALPQHVDNPQKNQPLTGKIGKYTIDLPEEINVTDGSDLKVRKSGDSLYIYFYHDEYQCDQ